MDKNFVREQADDISGDLSKYPDLANYIKGLNELATMNLSSFSYEEIGRIFYEKAILFQQTFGINAAGKFNKQRFYRARMNVDISEDIGLIRTFSYPPGCFCKENGRANLKGKSVFYCSNQPGTAIIESKPVAGKKSYLSIWEANTIRDVKYGICLPKDLRIENDFNFMANGIHQYIKDVSAEAKEKADHFQFFHQFVADRFVHETEPYPLTSWIANEMLYGPQWRDFIIYPSVANDTFSCNMAFHPNSVDSLLKFVKVVEFKVLQIQGGQVSFSEVRIGTLKNSMIDWHKPRDGELYEFMPEASKVLHQN
jgi:hypothetical protein